MLPLIVLLFLLLLRPLLLLLLLLLVPLLLQMRLLSWRHIIPLLSLDLEMPHVLIFHLQSWPLLPLQLLLLLLLHRLVPFHRSFLNPRLSMPTLRHWAQAERPTHSCNCSNSSSGKEGTPLGGCQAALRLQHLLALTAATIP